MNADGSSPMRLTLDPAYDGSPAWSPDGAHIAFTSNRDGEQKIYVMPSSVGGDPVPTNQTGADPAWSPDGQRIAFSQGPIHIMNADGTGVIRLTNPINDGIPSHGYEYDTNPAWSPDGASIVYARSSCWIGCSHRIMLVDPTGSTETTLVGTNGYEGTSEGEPVWSPEGRKVGFVDAQSVLVIRSDGTDLAFLTAGFNPAWRR
jgi:TolB protein